VARPARPVVLGMALEPQLPLFAGCIGQEDDQSAHPGQYLHKAYFDAKDYDECSWHDPSNNSRLTRPPGASAVKAFAGHAKTLLQDGRSVLDTAYEVGLSGPSRLHDLFVTCEAMTLGECDSGDRRDLFDIPSFRIG
jgi:hypothetical protein